MPTDPAHPSHPAHRAALDHVLALIAEAPWSEEVVLRGSRVLAAWYGTRAREAADLDFVVLPSLVPPLDEEHPYPYLDGAESIQQWPEAAGGAAGYAIWADGEQEHDHGGFRPRLAPEGLAWIVRPDPAEALPLIQDLRVAIGEQPQAGPGVLLEAEGVHGDGSWNYAYDADPYETGASYEGEDDGNGEGAGVPRGVRVLVPWRAADGTEGTVRLDFAQDDRMPEPAVWTMLPAAHRWEPLLVRTASRRVSLAWKLLWLHRDGGGGSSAPLCKDLYDAVLLAEDPRTDLSARLLRRVVRDNGRPAVLDVTSACPDEGAWAEFRERYPWVRGSAGDWLARLGVALAPVIEQAQAWAAVTGPR